MTLRDELEKIMAAADYVHTDDMRWLLRTHGAAMLEALVDAERYRWLRDSTANHMIVSHNDGCAPNYMTAKEWIDANQDMFDDTPTKTIGEMEESGDIWQVQWYPDTPVGFHCVFAASLDQAIDRARGGES